MRPSLRSGLSLAFVLVGCAKGTHYVGDGGSSSTGSSAGGDAATSSQSASTAQSTTSAESTSADTTASSTGTGAKLCGNGVVDPGEQCDGANLAGRTCATQGIAGGTLACNPDCTLNTSLCGQCNDGVVQPGLGEDCDFDAMGQPIIAKSCMALGFSTPGNTVCASNCKYDLTPCECGDGMLEPMEACDGTNLGSATCASLGFASGTLSCDSSCHLVTTGCSKCGNAMIDPGEQCDGTNLGTHTCMTEGFTGGTLACTAGCMLDTTGCTQGTCNPNGVWTISGAPFSYTCCSGNVDVNVSSFIFSSAGATVDASPSDPVTMTGSATSCPVGSFTDSGTIPGGCAETYTLTGSFSDANTWTGTYKLTFTGSQCSCFNGALGAPCVNQIFPVTATR